MLRDFYVLLPELYADKCCTAIAHLFSHLTKYVCLWGPLWTHSSFGFENKNGHIKNFVHNKSDVVSLLMFNIDMNITLQNISHVINQHESESTTSFLRHVNHSAMRSNMTKLSEHTFAVGVLEQTSLTDEQVAALQLQDNIAHTFKRLYKDNTMFHSRAYITAREMTQCAHTWRVMVRLHTVRLLCLLPLQRCAYYFANVIHHHRHCHTEPGDHDRQC